MNISRRAQKLPEKFLIQAHEVVVTRIYMAPKDHAHHHDSAINIHQIHVHNQPRQDIQIRYTNIDLAPPWHELSIPLGKCLRQFADVAEVLKNVGSVDLVEGVAWKQ